MHPGTGFAFTIGVFLITSPHVWGQSTLGMQEKAIAAIKRSGGEIKYDGQGTNRSVVSVVLTACDITPACIDSLKKLPSLRTLDL